MSKKSCEGKKLRKSDYFFLAASGLLSIPYLLGALDYYLHILSHPHEDNSQTWFYVTISLVLGLTMVLGIFVVLHRKYLGGPTMWLFIIGHLSILPMIPFGIWGICLRFRKPPKENSAAEAAITTD